MNILIVSPLFPPDTGAPADYVKELAGHLGSIHKVTLLIYGYLPESVEGVSIQTVDKRTSLPVRLLAFTKALFAQKSHDVVVLNNGPSAELPALLFSLLTHTPFILVISDPIALEASKNGAYAFLHRQVKKRALRCVYLDDISIYKKAERLPFQEFDEAREMQRNNWWEQHLKQLLS